MDETLEKREYNNNDIEILNQKIKNYIANNSGQKNFLEYCDNNSKTLETIRNIELDMEDTF
jgi:hypothetical protein